MSSPLQRTREASPEYTTTTATTGATTTTTTTERVIDVSSESPVLLRATSSDVTDVDDDETSGIDTDYDVDDDDDELGPDLTELELSEHEYRRGRHAVPMQSPGDLAELELDLDLDAPTARRRGGKLPALRRRRFFETSDEVGGPRRRMMRRITFRRRKKGEHDAFWTGIFVSNVLSLAVMVVLMYYLLQTDFFESHQSDLFGTTVDDRFTVVSPESTDAKIYLKSGYSTSRYSEAMIAFSDGELKVGRRALGPTDLQAFYGLSLASNGSATFTNKLSAPFVKTDYLHAARAVVFDDGTVMTTAANLSGGINEVGDLNLISKTGSVTLSAGGKPVIKIDPDATVNLLNSHEDELEETGIVMDAAKGDISIASTFKIHHDVNTTVLSSTNSIELNNTRVVIGSTNATTAILTCPAPTTGAAATKDYAYKPMSLVIMGQSSANQSRGGSVVVSGGDGLDRGGDVVLVGGKSAESEDGDVAQGSVLINARLDRTTTSTTEIGSHSKSHNVILHGTVSINNASESGHATSLFVSGGNVLVDSKNVTLDNVATNESSVMVKSNHFELGLSSGTSLVMDANSTKLNGTTKLVISFAQGGNTTESAAQTVDASGTIDMNATRHIRFTTTGTNSSVDFIGAVRFGVDPSDRNGSDSSPDMVIDDGDIAIDADTLTVGGAGATESISLDSNSVRIGKASQKTSLRVDGETTSVLSKRIQVGSSASNVKVTGHEILLHANKSTTGSSKVSIDGSSVSLGGGELRIGDKKTKSIAVGELSTSSVSITSSALDIGASAKTLTLGEKATTIRIGDEKSTIEILGEVALNGEKLSTRRRLKATGPAFFTVADQNQVVLQLPNSGKEIHVPIDVKAASPTGIVTTDDGNISLLLPGGRASTSYVRLGVTLRSVRVRADGNSLKSESPRRSPKLRCRVYKGGDYPVFMLEVVVPLESCDNNIDCQEGIFFGASTHGIVAVGDKESFSLRCAATPTGNESQMPNTVLIDHVQVDVSSAV